jgi:hypothetical protein
VITDKQGIIEAVGCECDIPKKHLIHSVRNSIKGNADKHPILKDIPNFKTLIGGCINASTLMLKGCVSVLGEVSL